MQLSSPETLPHISRCAETCLQCIVLVMLLGPPLIYHDDGSRRVPEKAVGPPLSRCGCVSTSPESGMGSRVVRWVCTIYGLAQVYLVLGGPRMLNGARSSGAWIFGNTT